MIGDKKTCGDCEKCGGGCGCKTKCTDCGKFKKIDDNKKLNNISPLIIN